MRRDEKWKANKIPDPNRRRGDSSMNQWHNHQWESTMNSRYTWYSRPVEVLNNHEAGQLPQLSFEIIDDKGKDLSQDIIDTLKENKIFPVNFFQTHDMGYENTMTITFKTKEDAVTAKMLWSK